MNHARPFVSVVLPTRNRPGPLGDLLDALAGQEYPTGRFETILVDDGGSSSLEAVVAPYRERLCATLMRVPHSWPAAARQAGVDVARGELLAFTDDDCRPATGWLPALERSALATPGAAIGGPVVNALNANLYSEATHLVVRELCQLLCTEQGEPRYLTTTNIAFPAERFRAIGGLDRTWRLSGGEDRELCCRWERAGHRIVFAPDALVGHAHHLDLVSFLRQHFNYGRGAFRFRYTAAGRSVRRIAFENWRFYARLLGSSLASFPPPRAAAVAGLVACSQLANAAGFVREAYGLVNRSVASAQP